MGCFHKCALWIMWPWNDLWPLPLGSTSTQKWARCQESPKGYLYQIWTFLVKSEMKYKSMTRAPGGWPLTWASQSMHLMQFPPCPQSLSFTLLLLNLYKKIKLCYIIPPGSPPPRTPWGHMAHMNNFWFKSTLQSLMEICTLFLEIMCFFFLGPPTQTLTTFGGPPGGRPSICQNKLCSSYWGVSTCFYKILWHNRFLIYKRAFSKIAPFPSLGVCPYTPPTPGPHAQYETLWVPAPRDDLYQIWLKSAHWFWIWSNENVLFFQLGPLPQTLTPLGAQGSLPRICHEQTSFLIYINIINTQNIMTQLLLYWEKKSFKFAIFPPLGAPTPGPPWGLHALCEQLWVCTP